MIFSFSAKFPRSLSAQHFHIVCMRLWHSCNQTLNCFFITAFRTNTKIWFSTPQKIFKFRYVRLQWLFRLANASCANFVRLCLETHHNILMNELNEFEFGYDKMCFMQYAYVTMRIGYQMCILRRDNIFWDGWWWISWCRCCESHKWF